MAAIACPFCRTSFPLPNSSSQRAVCPKCGETVPVKLAVEQTGATAPVGLPAASNWFKPALIASCLVSVVILAVGLWIVFSGDRRAPEPVAETHEPDAVRPPIALAGLGYLPGSSQVIAAVRPGPLATMSDAAGADPKKKLAEAGVPPVVLSAFDRLGVPLKQIDHIAVGLTLAADDAFPRVVVAVVLTRAPSDESTIPNALAAERVSGGDHPRYKASLGGLPVQFLRAAPTTYVFATEPKDLDGLDQPRPTNGDHFRPALWDQLMNRLSPASFAWVAAAGEATWSELPSVKLLAKFAKREDLLPVVATGRAGSIGLSFEPDPVLRVAVATENARPFGDWVAIQWADEKTVVETGDGWVAASTPSAIAEVPAKLGLLIPPAKK
jgi:hypothetical protein